MAAAAAVAVDDDDVILSVLVWFALKLACFYFASHSFGLRFVCVYDSISIV